MNRYLAPLVFCLALTAAQTFAREPQSPPSPVADAALHSATIGKDAKGRSLFVGHYGEAIAFPSSWTVDAEMHGETETVYFHRKSHDEFGYKPFQPKRFDYKPENFAPMGLMELVVIPKNAPGGLGSLAAIRGAKELELKKQGADYKVFEETGASGWPRATFHVATSKPYRLWQTYSESPSEFHILTFGGGVEAGEFGLDQARIDDINSAKGLVRRSLEDHLHAAQRRTVGGRLFHFRDEAVRDMFSDYHYKDFIRYDGSQPAAKFLTAAAAVMLILALWPGATAGSRRARLSGRSVMFFTLFAGSAGFLAVYLPATLAGALWNSDDWALVVPVPLLPVIGWAAARCLRSSKVGRVSIAMAALAAAWAFVILWGADMESLDSAPILAYSNAFAHLLIGLTFGVAFAAAFGPLPDKEVLR